MSEVGTETRDVPGTSESRHGFMYQQYKDFLNHADLSKALAIAARAWHLSAVPACASAVAALLLPVGAVFLALGASHDRSPNFTHVASFFL